MIKVLLISLPMYLESVSVPNSVDRHKLLETEFITRFSQYVGDGCSNINADLVANCIDNLKIGKASGLDGLMAEHLSFALLRTQLWSCICRYFSQFYLNIV